MCDTSFLAETSYKVNNCLWVAVHLKVNICLHHCSLLIPPTFQWVHQDQELEMACQQLSMFGNVLFRNVAETLLWRLVGRTTVAK